MSFILDALKKSEERRQQETPAVVGKQVVHLGAKKARHWPLWIVLILLPTALLIGWWLGQSPQAPAPGPRAQAESVSQKVTPAQPANEVATTTPQQPLRQATAPQPVKPQPQPEVTVVREQPQQREVTAAPVPLPAAPQAPTESQAEGHQMALAGKPTAALVQTEEPKETSLPSYMELPRELRNRMPRLKISLSFYSENPTRRMARINGRLLHEGEEVETGLTIHEITPTATVLDYQGLLFELIVPRR